LPEVLDQIRAPAVLGGQDVLARSGLGPVIPASDGPLEGGRIPSAACTEDAIGEGVREAPGTTRAAGPGERGREAVD
jgi:hypothetical protein